MTTDDARLARVETKVDDILEHTKCLPQLCVDVGKHDERLKRLESGAVALAAWVRGLIIAVVGIFLAAYVKLKGVN